MTKLWTVLGFIAVITCRATTLNAQAPAGDARTNELRSLIDRYEQSFTAKLDKLGPFTKREGKDRLQQQARLARRFFAEEVGKNHKKQQDLIDAICLSSDSGFAHLALCNMVDLLAREGQAESLCDLLSKRCPSRPHFQLGIEDVVIIIFRRELKDGTTVLCNAFDRSTDPVARSTIAEAIRRGYHPLIGIDGLDDKATITKVREWYLKNSAEYTPNVDYLSHFAAPAAVQTGVLVRKDDSTNDSK